MLELARALAEDQEDNLFLNADESMPPAGSPAPLGVNRGKRDGGAIAEWCFCGVLRFSEFDLPIRWRPTRVASIASRRWRGASSAIHLHAIDATGPREGQFNRVAPLFFSFLE